MKKLNEQIEMVNRIIQNQEPVSKRKRLIQMDVRMLRKCLGIKCKVGIVEGDIGVNLCA